MCDSVGTSYLCHNVVIAYNMAFLMTTELLVTFISDNIYELKQ